MTCLLTIVVPSHNRPDRLHTCLSSLTRFSPPGTRLLVVDDASPQAAISRVACSFKGVELLRRPTQGGFCKAVNAALTQVNSPFVQILNDDTEVTPNFVEPILARFTKPSVVAISPLVLSGDHIDSMGDQFFPAGFARKRGHGQTVAAHHLRPQRIASASGSASFYRTAILKACGGFAEEFGAYFEDVDLSFRLRRHGEIWYEPASRIQHHVSSSYGPPCGELLERQSRNEELLYWRHLSAEQLLLWLPAHIGVVALKAWLRWREGNLVPFWRGRRAAWASLPAILRYRADGWPESPLTPISRL
ncbi:MAG: glycosyltransferase [Gemmataceae bacterium]